MKCNKCGYDLKQEDGYCSNCGTKVEKKQGIECYYCRCVMSEESNYCPNCGKEVVKNTNGCKDCGYLLTREDLFCPKCGKEVSFIQQSNTCIDETKEEENAGGYISIRKTKSGYVKETPKAYTMEDTTNVSKQKNDDASIWHNPILWISSIALLIICLLLSFYMKQNPSSNSGTNSQKKVVEEKLDDLEITKDTSTFIMQANNNIGGISYRFEDKVYLSMDGSIYEMNLDFSDSKEVIDEVGNYIYVDDSYIYYCDKDYNYQRVDRKTDKKETLLEKVYYARIIDNMLYYQSDKDGETIHVYNLETKEDRKITNEKSYAMIVDSNVIYYTNEKGILSKINIDGTGSEVVLDASIISFVYEEGVIYYTSETGIYKMNLETKENTALLEKENVIYISLLEDKIVYSGYNVGLYTINKDGTNRKTITTNYIQGMEVQGDIVIYSDASKSTVYGATKDAKRTRIHKIKYSDGYNQEDLPNINGIQEF